MMDIGTLLFYAVVCGALAGASPIIGGRINRVGVGAGVGILAALSLPYIKSILGM